MRRHALLLAALAVLLAPLPALGAQPAPSWAAAEIRAVVAHGLMAPDAASFRPDDVLVRSELEELVGGLAADAPAATRRSDDAITMAVLNARLAGALGLQGAGRRFAQAVRAAGIAPTSRFGTEAVARLLGLRKNHPAARDALERLPNDPASRAEAAYSAARILRFGGWEVERVRAAAETFVLPELSPWQRRVLARAFSLVGFPYVWGGESERPDGPFGPQPQGGFDCSGFVWRVYKLEPYPGGAALGGTLRGRTTYAMSGEVPPRARIAFARLEPGDVIFFGAQGPRSKPAQIDHMGIYAGGGWFVHSSREGVALTPLEGWYRQRFAWARRPLAESGLEQKNPA